MDQLVALFDGMSGTPQAPVSPSAPVEASMNTAPSLVASSPSEKPPFSGQHFLAWLKERIRTHKLVINDAKALVHTVSDTAYLVSPGVFQRYAQEHPSVQALAKQEDLPDWRWVQKRFEKLQLHRKQLTGLNIWTCEIAGPRKSKRLHGYLLNDSALVFDRAPPNNPYLSLASTNSAEPS
jgi:hypothetical protein